MQYWLTIYVKMFYFLGNYYGIIFTTYPIFFTFLSVLKYIVDDSVSKKLKMKYWDMMWEETKEKVR